MDRRTFVKMSSVATLSAIGTWTGISKAWAGFSSPSGNEPLGQDDPSDGMDMETRRLGTLEVSAIGLGCLPMVGYYGGHYDKRDMIALNMQSGRSNTMSELTCSNPWMHKH